MASESGWRHFPITYLRREAQRWDATIAPGWFVSLRDEKLQGRRPRVGDVISLCLVHPDPPGTPLRQYAEGEVLVVTWGEMILHDSRAADANKG